MERKPPPSRGRSQTECLALTPSYEGKNSGDETTQNDLKYPKEQKKYIESEFNRVTLLN